MGQKINPQSLRLGIVKDWSSRWFFSSLSQGAGKPLLSKKRLMAKLLEEDEAIRSVVAEKIDQAGVADLTIERTPNDVKITIKAARPGIVIGRGGQGIEDLNKAIVKKIKGLHGKEYKMHVSVNVEELKRSEVSGNYIAQQIAWDIEKRLPYRRAMKKQLDQVAQNREAKGAKILLSGRLGGGEIARREVLRWGALPLQTLRADIDYGTATARTTYGAIGIKVWVFRGEKLARLYQDKGNTEVKKDSPFVNQNQDNAGRRPMNRAPRA
jgi:small subunit ribosomal protein S3